MCQQPVIVQFNYTKWVTFTYKRFGGNIFSINNSHSSQHHDYGHITFLKVLRKTKSNIQFKKFKHQNRVRCNWRVLTIVIHSKLEPEKSKRDETIQLVFQFVLIFFTKMVIIIMRENAMHAHPSIFIQFYKDHLKGSQPLHFYAYIFQLLRLISNF